SAFLLRYSHLVGDKTVGKLSGAPPNAEGKNEPVVVPEASDRVVPSVDAFGLQLSCNCPCVFLRQKFHGLFRIYSLRTASCRVGCGPNFSAGSLERLSTKSKIRL